MNKVVIVDYGMCNLDSIARAVEECGGSPAVSGNPQDLNSATHIILPGVGAFAEAMRNLGAGKLAGALREQALGSHIPLLGICLGMQLLASKGYEGGETEGLDLIRGEVRKLEPFGEDRRIPHIGWNEVRFDRESPLFEGLESGKDFYFVHSYHFVCEDRADAAAHTPYARGFVSVVSRDLVFGTQFHPEKSQDRGFQILRNFLRL